MEDNYQKLIITTDDYDTKIKHFAIDILVKQIKKDNNGSEEITLEYFKSQRFREVFQEYNPTLKSLFRDIKQGQYRANRKYMEFNLFKRMLDNSGYWHKRAKYERTENKKRIYKNMIIFSPTQSIILFTTEKKII